MSRYLEMLSLFGVAGAHPGGLAFTKTVLRKAALPSNLPILDAGCGTGQTAAYLGHLLYPVTVIDKDPVMLEKAKKDSQVKDCQFPLISLILKSFPFPLKLFLPFCRNPFSASLIFHPRCRTFTGC